MKKEIKKEIKRDAYIMQPSAPIAEENGIN